jgi:quercetin dioxygenase-like cupin family protein
MEVIRKDQGVEEDLSDAPIFFGGKVTKRPIVDKAKTQYFDFNVVSFKAGARNKFHTHTSDQILYVTKSHGIIASEDEEVIIEEGDTAFIPAGEKHWHGATAESDFSHISLQSADSITTVLD